MRVVVLGCGPAGMTAAWAAISLEHSVTIISKRWEPSILYGCQYLHEPIPGFEDVPSTTVRYGVQGTSEQYRDKVYGSKWHGRVSPEDFVGEHQAWDIRETYRRLWAELNGMTMDITAPPVMTIGGIEIKHGDIDSVRKMMPDKIISTIPATDLCYQPEHTFRSHHIYASGSTIQDDMPDNYVWCNGTNDVDWYRNSSVFGYRTVEWPSRIAMTAHGRGAVRVNKPLDTNCECHKDIIRVGRYGEWSKGVLVHQVYDKVVEALK